MAIRVLKITELLRAWQDFFSRFENVGTDVYVRDHLYMMASPLSTQLENATNQGVECICWRQEDEKAAKRRKLEKMETRQLRPAEHWD